MASDKKPEDQITEAGAVELDETQLDNAAGGVIAITEVKIAPEHKFSPEVKLNPELKFRG